MRRMTGENGCPPNSIRSDPRLMSRLPRRLTLPAKFLAGFVAAALALTGFITATAAFFRPDLTQRPAMPSDVEAVAARNARAARLDPAHPSVVWQDVNYADGARAAWSPQGE